MQGADEAGFGPWRAVRPLSRGAASEVYLARHSDDGSIAALKTFPAATEIGDERIRRAREIRLLGEVDHPRVVRILDWRTGAVWPDRDYIVTEYVSGGDLAALVRRAPLSLASTRLVGVAIAQALACLHQSGIVHRDVKPANVFVPSPGEQGAADFAEAKLGDLGIAIEVDATRVTSHGLAIGTANYLSPEQVSGTPITPASDVYSLGLVLLECVTGARAYGGAGVEAALARLHRAPEIPAEAPRALRRLLRDMLALDPQQRPMACAVAARLSEMELPDRVCAMDGAATRPLRMPSARGPRRSASRRTLLMAAAGVGAAAVVTIGVLHGTTGVQSPAGAPAQPTVPASADVDPSGESAPSGGSAAAADAADIAHGDGHVEPGTGDGAGSEQGAPEGQPVAAPGADAPVGAPRDAPASAPNPPAPRVGEDPANPAGKTPPGQLKKRAP